MIKKLITLFAVFAAVFTFTNAAAANDSITYPTGTQFVGTEVGQGIIAPPDDGSDVVFQPFASLTLEEYLTEQCMSHAETINIKSYRISSDEIFDIYCAFAQKHPELLIKTSLSWDKTVITGYANNIKPVYITSSVQEDFEARNLMQKAIGEYISAAAPFSNAVEKILVIHDKMVENYKYDSNYSDESYHAYGLFKNKTAVCQGYAQAFYMIMREMGFDCDFCVAHSINHIWNYIKINGKWYHIDLTWDDPVIKNSNGEIVERTTAYHDNFLVSDANIAASHCAKIKWATYLSTFPTCGNSFESGYLFNIEKPFTIDFSDGCFKAACTVSGKALVFNSKSLNPGLVASAKPVKSGSSTAVYYYGLSDFGGNLSVVSAGGNMGKTSSFTVNSRGSIIKNTLYKAVIKPKSTDNYTDVFFWDMNTLKPYSDKVRIEN